jgi:CxxC motif-containing protein (DUF1111 family)
VSNKFEFLQKHKGLLAIGAVFLLVFLLFTGGFDDVFSNRGLTDESRVIDLYGQDTGSPLPGLPDSLKSAFNEGKDVFAKQFGLADGLGPRYNARSCEDCHSQTSSNSKERGLVYFGAFVAKSPLGRKSRQDQDNNKDKSDIYDFDGLERFGGPVLFSRSVTEEFKGEFPDCSMAPYTVPDEAIFVDKRIPSQLLGLGLIDAIDEQSILSNMLHEARTAPELKGRTNPVRDPLTESNKIGRFGPKADSANLLLAIAKYLRVGLGVTTLIEDTETMANPLRVPDCVNLIVSKLATEPNDNGAKLVRLNSYLSLMSPPRAKELSKKATAGQSTFKRLNCAVCHTPELDTAAKVEIIDLNSPLPGLRYIEVPSLSHKPVRLYSDLLLHDMGPELADGIVQGTARGGEWRTTPLWGLGTRKYYLHDGRAISIDQAIQLHGGQAKEVSQAYQRLQASDKENLLEFLQSL